MYFVMDCISKEEPSPSALPSSSNSPHPLSFCVSVASVFSLYFKEKGATIAYMLPISGRITLLDKYRLCHCYGHCEQKLPVFTVVCSSVGV